MIKYIVWISVSIFFAGCSLLPGHHTPQQAQPSKSLSNKNMDHKKNFFVAQKGIEDGYVFIFHIMPAPEGTGYSRSNYHVMVSIEKDNQPVSGLALSSDVKHPDGMIEKPAPMMQMGDWYMALYNLNHEKGQHWITASFKQDGKTYSSGVYYPERAYHE